MSHDTKFLQHFASLRNEKYPTVTDYESVVYTARIWGFTEAGRFIHGYAASLFMFQRSAWETECLDFFALTDLLGVANTFVLTSPGLATAPNRENLFEKSWSDVEIYVASQLVPVEDVENRLWIKVLQFENSHNQQLGKISDWVSSIEEYSPIKRSYVCGADWAWLESVLKSQKIGPFRGNLSAAYVFLLRNVEKGDPDYSAVKSILRPVFTNNDLSDFVNLIIGAYGKRSSGFFYFFLTPENLLLSGLAYSEIEALAGRIYALETCIKKYSFCDNRY